MPEGVPKKTEYFSYYKFPLKAILGAARLDRQLWRISSKTGGWVLQDPLVYVELESDSLGEHSVLDREGFIDLTERTRARYLRGEGPVFALYEAIKAITEQAEVVEGRPLTPAERAMVKGLRRKSYVMFERELAARGDPGADPDPES